MNNMNIQAYKDGNDLILVFKNVDTTLESLVTSMLLNVTTKSVPALNIPVEEPMTKPENFEEYEEIIPEFLSENYDEDSETLETTTPIEENPTPIEDPTSVNSLLEYITLYSKIKLGFVNDEKTCIALLKNFKNLNKNEFGKTMGENLDKDTLSTILIEINKFAPDAVSAKTKMPLSDYLEKSTISNLRYAIRGLIWYNVKL